MKCSLGMFNKLSLGDHVMLVSKVALGILDNFCLAMTVLIASTGQVAVDFTFESKALLQSLGLGWIV